MRINPFKDTNFNDFQEGIISFYEDRFDTIRELFDTYWKRFKKKGNERITIMFIPHSERKIVNFHISIFMISGISGLLALIITITSILIFNHTSTVKEVSRLKLYGSDSVVQIKFYVEEINHLFETFQLFKPEITYLYSLDPDKNVETLWAKGGAQLPVELTMKNDSDTPAARELKEKALEALKNIDMMERDMSVTKDTLEKIKIFMEQRKNIIKNTPSLWPVNGYIVASFGRRSTPFSSREEYNNGIAIVAYPGTEIRATAPGEVGSVTWDSVQGLSVTIRHKYGFSTVYSHCQRVSVEENQKVNKGDTIAYVGRTGRVSRHLLEYRVQIGTEYVDPVPYLNKITREIK